MAEGGTVVGKALAQVAAGVRSLRGFRRTPAVPDAPVEVPSADSVARLDGRIRAATDGHRQRLRDDLARVEALLELGEDEAAAEVLEEYTAVLRAYKTQLEEAVGEAVAVREAERLTAQGALHEPTAVEPADEPGPARRAATALMVVVALGLAPLLSSATERPTVDASELAAVEAELAEVHTRLLELAREPASGNAALVEAHALHDRILALHSATLADERIKATLDRLLVLEVQALEPLAERTPEAQRLLAEVRALRASLELDDEADERETAEEPPESDRDDPSTGRDGAGDGDQELSNGLTDEPEGPPGTEGIDAVTDALEDVPLGAGQDG